MEIRTEQETLDDDPNRRATAEERRVAREMMANAKVVSWKDSVAEATAALDKYCKQFGASSYYELMSWADLGEKDIPPLICSEILEYHSTLEMDKELSPRP